MNTIAAHITETSIVVAERNDASLVTRTVATEDRPATLAQADTFLAFHSLGRTAAWDLGPVGSVTAPVATVDNRFNGTVAARLDQAVGTTHEAFDVAFAYQVSDGDLIADMELEGVAVVAGSSPRGELFRIHMVTEGKTWEDRWTTDFPRHQLVQLARKIDARRAAEVAMSAGEGEI